jgi:hypothetical protein
VAFRRLRGPTPLRDAADREHPTAASAALLPNITAPLLSPPGPKPPADHRTAHPAGVHRGRQGVNGTGQFLHLVEPTRFAAQSADQLR